MVVRPRGWHLPEKHVLVDGERDQRQPVRLRALLRSTARSGSSTPGAARTSTCRRWRATSRPGSGTTSSPSPRTASAPRAAPSAARCSSRPTRRPSRWRRSSTSCASTRAGSTPAGGTTSSASSRSSAPGAASSCCRTAPTVTMTVPFMRAYTELLVRTCHKRGASAIGGMAAFIPSRKDPEVNETAMGKVHEDKKREAEAGYDGSWVAHPDLVPICREEFDAVLGDRPNQLDKKREDVSRHAPSSCSTSPPRRARSPRRACAATSASASSTWRRGSRVRRGRHLQPHGGRRHRRDQPLAGVAVDLARRRAAGRRRARRRDGHPATWSTQLADEEVASSATRRDYADAASLFLDDGARRRLPRVPHAARLRALAMTLTAGGPGTRLLHLEHRRRRPTSRHRTAIAVIAT